MRPLSITVLSLCFVALATPTRAQKVHKYDPSAEVTVTGVVADYHESKKRGDHPGLHFILEVPPAPAETAPAAEEAETTDLAPQAESPETAVEAAPPAEVETLEVHACPVRLLSQLDFPIEKGDELTVSGSRPGGGEVIIAREIKKGTVSLQLRDEKGVPIWTGLP
jgi:hypothetical protein